MDSGAELFAEVLREIEARTIDRMPGMFAKLARPSSEEELREMGEALAQAARASVADLLR